MVDRETIITETDSGAGSGGLGIAIALLIVVLLIAGGWLVFGHNNSGGSSVTLDVPKVTVNTNNG